MTLTGVCKGLSIIAFLAGLRFYNIFRKSSKGSPLFYCRFYKLPVGPDSEERLDVDESEKKDKEKEVKEEEEEKKKEKKKKKKELCVLDPKIAFFEQSPNLIQIEF